MPLIKTVNTVVQKLVALGLVPKREPVVASAARVLLSKKNEIAAQVSVTGALTDGAGVAFGKSGEIRQVVNLGSSNDTLTLLDSHNGALIRANGGGGTAAGSTVVLTNTVSIGFQVDVVNSGDVSSAISTSGSTLIDVAGTTAPQGAITASASNSFATLKKVSATTWVVFNSRGYTTVTD